MGPSTFELFLVLLESDHFYPRRKQHVFELSIRRPGILISLTFVVLPGFDLCRPPWNYVLNCT